MASTHHPSSKIRPTARMADILRLEKSDIIILMALMLGVGLINLAVPITIQTFINTVTMGSLIKPLVIISFMLFVFLSLVGFLYALEFYVVELIQRRLFVRTAFNIAEKISMARLHMYERNNMVELVNRFFEVTTVQKSLGTLLTTGVATIFQGLTGSVLLIFYSVYFGVMAIIIIMVILFIVFVIGRRGEMTAISESHAKYSLAAWLETIARSLNTFRFSSGEGFAMQHVDVLSKHYLEKRQSHFRILFSQLIGGVFIYAVGGTTMLALGGVLVVTGEINLGQFVAAELIIFTVMASFLRFIGQLEYYYDLLAGLDKLGIIQDLPQERTNGSPVQITGPLKLELFEVCTEAASDRVITNDITFQLEAGRDIAILGADGSGKSKLAQVIVGLRQPVHGRVQLNNIDLNLLNIEAIRKHIVLLHKVEIIEASIRDNVKIWKPDTDIENISAVLEQLGLLDAITRLEHGAETKLHFSGAPLIRDQAKLLMIARAVVAQPALLLINELLDTLEQESLDKALAVLRNQPFTLVILTRSSAIANQCERVISLEAKYRRT
ncbi:ATP-binding cassette domain-containing protein [Nitrosomonas halophila]|uniref:ABC-type bacteriocin/lantibiotic exporter, contains an N-terminal double-glycine peptidase domain n=1 Tax=Nitrosomonas halophila TaxID=44576 RepID=A0A1H3BSL9_9PROT|nr:ABC transporter ATP-binding protein [Nitrosomonas halophila]SDX44169.1 ABC-type bacteriocin/lantibiotic exporter, contains an N-terminal double-glycine peptidase domain [Nitrosomonas halophila]